VTGDAVPGPFRVVYRISTQAINVAQYVLLGLRLGGVLPGLPFLVCFGLIWGTPILGSVVLIAVKNLC
jgi:hypothetical protein